MDKGAHFRRCDFQVHTPRDINWVGDRAVSEDERKEYAESFVRACRTKGIGAVAITDHHDMEFVSYISAAANEEVGEDGSELALHKKLVVLPGMELTLTQPCQALLIFDANFPDSLFPVVYASLTINPTPKSDNRTAQIGQLDFTLEQLHETLNAHAALKGRYIVLPNVTDGGYQTLMRQHFQGHYSKMPCVGGYTDKGVSLFGEGHRKILEGKIPAWGSKSLGIFQTSDSRNSNLQALGEFSTWVKWSEPTAEALRQACLARESRLSHEQPQLPLSVVQSISVANARFLGNFHLDFNSQYTAIIGGRGTGKSTILEYLRWALCDEPLFPSDEEAADFQNRRVKLIDRTLTESAGSVEVRVSKNGVAHTVRRSAKDKKLLLKIGNGDFEAATEEQVRAILPIQAYSQKQLSSVGIRVDQLLKFVELPIREALDDIARQMQTLSGELREQFARYVRKARLSEEISRLEREAESTKAQVEATRKNLTGISREDRETVAKRSYIDQEQRLLQSLTRDIDVALEILNHTSVGFEKLIQSPESIESLPNKEVAVEIFGIAKEALQKEMSQLHNASNNIRGLRQADSRLSTLVKQWQEEHTKFQAQYTEAKQRSSAHEGILTRLAELETKLQQQHNQLDQLQSSSSELGEPDKAFPFLLAQWQAHQRAIADLQQGECEKLTALSEQRIRATITRYNDFSAVTQLLQANLRGSSVRGNKLEDLFATAKSADDPLNRWAEILSDLQRLALLENPVDGSPELPQTPILQTIFSEQDLVRIASKIGPEEWLSLALTEVKSTPRFEYMARPLEYIPFEEASAGQQATALLWALLNQDGPPLIIDQPEDDLDSQIIVQIINQVWNAKSRRQLIFTSHNANLVVNGDAELVVCCDYLIAGEQSKGQIKLEGAIDMSSIREEITKVMEGGKQAFKLRKDKYGF